MQKNYLVTKAAISLLQYKLTTPLSSSRTLQVPHLAMLRYFNRALLITWVSYFIGLMPVGVICFPKDPEYSWAALRLTTGFEYPALDSGFPTQWVGNG
jgi:hypothetical protein